MQIRAATKLLSSTLSKPRLLFPQPIRTMSSLSYTPERAAELKENIDGVLAEVRSAGTEKSRLVAISKIKPSSDIMALYDAGHRHFGENYIQELSDKAKELPKDIQWHFVGNLQSNKVKLATAIPNLFALESLESLKKATLLEASLATISPPHPAPLNVFLQINTSSESNKSGIPPLSSSPTPSDPTEVPEIVALALHVVKECPHLRLLGLMTIGSFEASHAEGTRNPDFLRLVETREVLEGILGSTEGVGKGSWGRKEEEGGGLELSMGMSADFKEALREGSDNVRVGTSIFGSRPTKP